jgi:hypothetical protein
MRKLQALWIVLFGWNVMQRKCFVQRRVKTQRVATSDETVADAWRPHKFKTSFE